jgi:hypothetical protein
MRGGFWHCRAGGSLIEFALVLGVIGAAAAATFYFSDVTRNVMMFTAYCVIDMAC